MNKTIPFQTYKIRFLLITLLALLPFQNCTPMHSNTLTNESEEEGANLIPGETQADRFSKAMDVLNTKCVDCHSASGQAKFAPFDLTSEKDFIDSGLVNPGDVNSSIILLRSQFGGQANSNMPTDNRFYTNEDFMTLYYWVSKMTEPDPIIIPPPSEPPPVEKNPVVTSFNLINTQLNQIYQENVAGTLNLNLSEINFDLKITANVNPDVLSTSFKIRGIENSDSEDNQIPFEVYESGHRLKAGTYVIEARPFSQTGLGGTEGSPQSLTLNIINDTIPPPTTTLDLTVLGFNIINADTDQIYTSGVNNSITLNLSDINFNMNIEAIVGSDAKSVELEMSGDKTRTKQENFPPYALFPQPTVTDFSGELFGPGIYVVTTTAFENSNLMGQKGLPQSLTITVIDDTPLTPFMAAKEVLSNHCIQCHTTGTGSQHPLNFQTEDEYISAGLVVAGEIDQSKIIYRTIHYSGQTAGPQNMPKGSRASQFTIESYNKLASWITQIQDSTNPPPPIQQFSCVNRTQSSATLNHTLTKKQYINSLQELFGNQAINAIDTSLSAVTETLHNEASHQRLTFIASADVLAYHNVAENLASYITNNDSETTKVFGSCALASNPSNNCINQYLNQFAPRILRRPLTNNENTFAQTIMSQPTSYKNNLKALLSYHLQSPAFIWRLELTSGQVGAVANSYKLTPFEIASRISFMTTDSTPDSELFQAAVNNQLQTESQIKAQVRRLLQTPKGKEKIINWLAHWSMSNNAQDLSNLPAALKGSLNTSGLENAMNSEALQFIEHIVYTRQGSFKNLLTSRDSLAKHSGLASIYGHSPVTGGQVAQMSGRRQGLLLRAPFLTWSTERTSVIHRGVDFQKRILCNSIPSPDLDIAEDRNNNALTAEEKINYTNRDIVAHETNSPACMGCHSVINPTGFAFENFDSFGRIRDQELVFDTQMRLQNTLPVDSNSNIPLPQNQSIEVNDAYDLVSYVATSSQGTACFTKNIFRKLYEKKESSQDDCQLEDTFKTVFEQDQSITEVITQMIANDYLEYKYMQ